MSFLLLAAIAVSIPAVQPGVPNRQPQLASGPGYSALVFGSGGSIWYTRSGNGEHKFEKAVRIADVPDLMLGRHRGPRVAVAGNDVVVTAISGGKSGSLLAWRSPDRGATWSTRPMVINDEPHAAREGLHNLAVDGEGNFAVVWLDLRAAGTRLYGAFSRDHGATWSKNLPLYVAEGGTICQCCHPSITAKDNGQFEVMFRNVMDGSRDMYALMWTLPKGVSAIGKQGSGTWKINACPMDGGGIAVRNHSIVSAWRRDHQVILAKDGKPEQVLGEGKDISLAAAPAGVFVSWTGSDGTVYLHEPSKTAPVTLGRHGAFPALAATASGVLAAWEENDAITAEFVNP